MIILKEASNKKLLQESLSRDLQDVLDLDGITAYEVTTPNLNMRALAPAGGGYLTSSQSLSTGIIHAIKLISKNHKTLLNFNAAIIKSVRKQQNWIRFDLRDGAIIEVQQG